MELNNIYSNDGYVYLNYAATSYPKSKIALHSFFKAVHCFPEGSRQNRISLLLEECRKRIGSVIGVAKDTVFFTHGASLGLNQVILGFMKSRRSFAIDNRSHNAVLRPWHSLKSQKNCFLADLYDENDQLIQENLIKTLAKSPDLLCLSHISNVNGSIYPVEKIIDFVKSEKPTTSILVDASQSAGNVPLATLKNADFIVFPSHKHLHSLPGAAVVIAKKRLEPIIYGGTGENSLSKETLASDGLFAEIGTINFPAIQAMVDSLEYAESNFVQHARQEKNLLELLLNELEHIEGLELIGKRDIEDRVGIIALKTECGLPEIHWVPFLHSQKIYVRGGLHCSPLHHQQLGLSNCGSLRLSLGWGSTGKDIRKALYSLKEFSKIAKIVV